MTSTQNYAKFGDRRKATPFIKIKLLANSSSGSKYFLD